MAVYRWVMGIYCIFNCVVDVIRIYLANSACDLCVLSYRHHHSHNANLTHLYSIRDSSWWSHRVGRLYLLYFMWKTQHRDASCHKLCDFLFLESRISNHTNTHKHTHALQSQFSHPPIGLWCGYARFINNLNGWSLHCTCAAILCVCVCVCMRLDRRTPSGRCCWIACPQSEIE